LKAVLVVQGLEPPRTHSVHLLIKMARDCGVAVPDEVMSAGELTHFAVQARYPGFDDDIDETEWALAVARAETVVVWAASVVGASQTGGR